MFWLPRGILIFQKKNHVYFFLTHMTLMCGPHISVVEERIKITNVEFKIRTQD
jgi:hypothetical protein